MNKQDLIDFEEEIKELFLAAKIRAPVHLSRGNEEPLLEIFEEVKPEDWCLSTHRSHFHALLKGVPPDEIRDEILAGHSMHLNFQEHNFFTSAIVGGIAPIALGVAMAIKRKGEKRQVWCFVGDMASHTGIFHECTKYAENFNLPITLVVEDNSYSVNTPTKEVWGKDPPLLDLYLRVWGINTTLSPQIIHTLKEWDNGRILYYRYERGFPHSGVGQWVKF